MEYFIIFLPLLGAFITGFFGNKFDQKYSQFITSVFVSVSSILSIIILLKVINLKLLKDQILLQNILDKQQSKLKML